MKRKLITVCLCLIFLMGCISSIDPITGEKTYSADPCTVTKIEQGAETAIGILNLLGIFWPELLVVGSVGAGIYGTYKRTKPKIDEARTEAQLYHTSTETLVAIIEDLKTKQPELWEKLKPLLESQMGQNIENVIRAIRGLPAKT